MKKMERKMEDRNYYLQHEKAEELKCNWKQASGTRRTSYCRIHAKEEVNLTQRTKFAFPILYTKS